MKAKVAREKGARYERYLIEVLREHLDAGARRTHGSGAGLDKNDINLPAFDVEIEAKNHSKNATVVQWWEQAKIQGKKSNRNTVLIFRNPKLPEFQENLVVMDLYEWMEIMKCQKEQVEVINNQDPNLKWKIKKLKDAAHEVFKEL